MMPNPSAVPNQPVRAATLDGIGSGEAHSAYDDAAWDNGVDPLWVWVLDSGVQPFDGADGATSVTYSSLKLRLDAMWARIRRIKVDASASLDAAVISPIGDDNSGVALMTDSGALVADGARALAWTTTAVTIPKQLVVSTGTVTSDAARIFFPGIKQAASTAVFARWDATAGELVAASSRRELKTNERLITDGLAIIRQLQPTMFDTVDGTETDVPGFIAEDLHDVGAGVATVDADGAPSGVQLEAIVSYLVAAVKQLEARMDAA